VRKKVEKFEDLEVWQIGMHLAEQVYRSLEECRDYALRSQMQRATVSIPSNIAEGFDRMSNKEFIRYLFIAKGSCAELRTQITLCIRLGIINKTAGGDFLEITRKLSAMLSKLIKTRQEKF